MSDISCLGIYVADLVGFPIDSLPERGRLAKIENMELHIGGCAANTGIDLQRLGIDTAVLGMVGNDGLGDFVFSSLQKEGLDTRGICRNNDVNTSSTMVIVDSEGERTFLHYFGANAQYSETDVNWDVIKASKLMHVAGALVMPGLDGEPMARIMKRSQEFGIPTSLDTVWDATGQWLKILGPVLEYTDYFMPSMAEAQKLTGHTDCDSVSSFLLDHGVKTVALKLGEEGCYVRSKNGIVRAPSYKVKAVDGTGSGDAYDAGFLLGIIKGWDITKIAHFANAVGAMSVMAVGATSGVKSLNSTLEFMQSFAD